VVEIADGNVSPIWSSSRSPACRNNGSTRSMKNGNSSLKFTNESVAPENPSCSIYTIFSAIVCGLPISG
jgi:hypothetical protein